jgi:hypothetical protein
VLVNGISAFADVDLPVRQKCIVEALSYVLSLMLIDRKLIRFSDIFCLPVRQIFHNILLEPFRVKSGDFAGNCWKD